MHGEKNFKLEKVFEQDLNIFAKNLKEVLPEKAVLSSLVKLGRVKQLLSKIL